MSADTEEPELYYMYQSYYQTPMYQMNKDKAMKISPELLDIKIYGELLQKNVNTDETLTNEVNYKCIISETKLPCFEPAGMSSFDLDREYHEYEISFVPLVAGTYRIVSAHFLSNTEFFVDVERGKDHLPLAHPDQVSTLFSSATIRRSLSAEPAEAIAAGQQIEIHLVLRDHSNRQFPAEVRDIIFTECNLHTESYYTVGRETFQFQRFKSHTEEVNKGVAHDSLALYQRIYTAGLA